MARDKTLTKANRREWEGLIKAEDVARNAVFDAVPSRNVPYAACFEAATKGQQQAALAASEALRLFETRMVDEGRGYWGLSHIFRPY